MWTRLIFAAAVSLGALSLGVVTAQAMPVTAVKQAIEATEVIPVAGGCGPGWFRNAYGVCRPMRRPPAAVYVAPVPYVAAPVVVAPVYRTCPRGMFRNRYGRCVWY